MKKGSLRAGGLFLLLAAWVVNAGAEYRFAVVPQQTPSMTIRAWNPLIRLLAKRTGYPVRLVTYKSIPAFEAALREGRDDFAYMNPYHYVVFHESTGYEAVAHARDRRVRGIIVVRKDSPIDRIEQLQDRELAFPSPGAFAASLLTRAWLQERHIRFTPVYVRSHDSVYLNVVRGRFPAGGGILRTLNAQNPEIRDQLRVLHATEAYTPHAIAALPTVPRADVARLQRVLVEIADDEEGRRALEALRVKGWVAARDADWNDIRQLRLEDLP